MQQPRQIATWNREMDFWETDQVDIFGHSVAFSETLPKRGMTVGGRLYELPMSVPLTTERECSSSPRLPTPQASDWKRENNPADNRRKSPNITAVDTYFPTPRTTDANGAGKHGTGGPDLRTAVAGLSIGDDTDQLFDVEG